MTVQQMRNAILEVYDTKSWKKKVANMYDDQIIAIYHSFNRKGMLGTVVRKEKPEFTDLIPTPVKHKEPECEQMTIFELM